MLIDDIERKNHLQQKKTVAIKFLGSSRHPPIIELSSHEFNNNTARFFIDTGADITICKLKALNSDFLKINTKDKVTIKGITPGKSSTLGSTYLSLHNLESKIHIVDNEFPIQTEGLLGYEFIEKYKGKINTERKCLELPGCIIPFIEDEKFIIPPNTRQIIYATVSNPEVQTGYVEMHDLGKELLFGNFIGTNRNGKIYAYVLNISDKEMTINPPKVTLEPYEFPIFPKNTEIVDNSDTNIFRLLANSDSEMNQEPDYEQKEDRPARIFELLDPCTLSHLNNEEISHVKSLIKNHANIFALPGEKLKATDLITHTINLTSNAPVKAKRFRNPPALDEALQTEIDSLVKKGVLAPSTSEYSSPTWVIKSIQNLARHQIID